MKDQKENNDGSMPFLEHIRELRNRLIFSFIAITICSIIAYVYYDLVIAILSKPFAVTDKIFQNKTFVLDTIYEGFVIKIKISIVVGIVLASPVIFYNIIKFILPALKKKEKKVIFFVLISSFILIITSGYYIYYKVIPFSITFLMSKGFVPKTVVVLLKFGKNIFYMLQFLLITLIVFQLPIVLELLLYWNILKRKTLLKFTRYIIVAIFVIAAIVTPPDFISQLSFALPLTVLFFLAILIAKIFKFGEEES